MCLDSAERLQEKGRERKLQEKARERKVGLSTAQDSKGSLIDLQPPRGERSAATPFRPFVHFQYKAPTQTLAVRA